MWTVLGIVNMVLLIIARIVMAFWKVLSLVLLIVVGLSAYLVLHYYAEKLGIMLDFIYGVEAIYTVACIGKLISSSI